MPFSAQDIKHASNIDPCDSKERPEIFSPVPKEEPYRFPFVNEWNDFLFDKTIS